MEKRPEPSTAHADDAAASIRELRRAAAIGQALARARHDLNNLFHVATGWSRLLRDPETRAEELREGVDAVLTSSTKISALISGILALDGRDSGTTSVVDLARKLQELARGLEHLLPVRGRLRVELPEQALVVCNYPELRLALLDFVLEVRDRLGDGELRLTLRDALPNESFAIERELVLECISASDAAQTLEPRLTLRFPAEQSLTLAAPVFGLTEPGSTTVLLVDAHRDVRRLATTMLERAGYQVLTAQDAAEARETSQNYDGPIHVLCCDADSSALAAERLISELQSHRPTLRVLVCSSEQRLGMLDRYPRLEKPFSYQRLIAAVRACGELEAAALPQRATR